VHGFGSRSLAQSQSLSWHLSFSCSGALSSAFGPADAHAKQTRSHMTRKLCKLCDLNVRTFMRVRYAARARTLRRCTWTVTDEIWCVPARTRTHLRAYTLHSRAHTYAHMHKDGNAQRAMEEMEYWIPALELFLVLCLGCAVYDQEVKLPQLEAECLHSIHTV